MGIGLGKTSGLGLLAAIAFAAVALVANSVSAQTAINEWGIPTTNSQPANIAPDSFGNLWFTETTGNKIAKITQNGVIQEYSVTTPDSQPWGIAVDSGNRVWFTEFAGNKIGNLTPHGQMGQDNIPTSDSKPAGIAIDGSGNVWFAESGSNKIGKMTPAGEFTEYNVPTADSQPWMVAIDSSGNVWFTERMGNKIGKLNPSNGQFEEYGIPTSDSEPWGIAIDGSGNVWVAEHKANKIAVRSASGSWTEYDIPIRDSKPTALVIDKLGSVWYAGYNTNSFGRVHNGTITTYGINTANSAPYGVALDGNGNLWLTEQVANKIGKAVGVVPVVTPTPTFVPIPTSTPAPRDVRYFDATGFRIDNDVFWDYFNKRGGIRTFGYPVSRTFTFLGTTVQFYQRAIMQIGPSGNAQTMNVLDSGLMPYTKINGSTYPAPDQALAGAAPVPGTEGYDVRIQEFVRNNAPDNFEGLRTNFYQAFQNTVTLGDAYPQGGGNPALLPLLNLELWGAPTSRPQRDPNNHNFVYLRFQRGIMHYDATTGFTQGLLLADYLKSIITGNNLPGDLANEASGSRFYRQYNPSKPNWLDRPEELPGTNLTFAFERQ